MIYNMGHVIYHWIKGILQETTFFLCLIVFGSFLKTTFLTIRDSTKNYFGKTRQDREFKYSPV